MLNASLVPIKPFPLPPVQEPTIEIAEFPTIRVEDAFPYMSYINHMYIYPSSLKYDTQKTFHRARNIACVVELRDSDAKDAQPLKVIFLKLYFSILSVSLKSFPFCRVSTVKWDSYKWSLSGCVQSLITSPRLAGWMKSKLICLHR